VSDGGTTAIAEFRSDWSRAARLGVQCD